MEPQRFGKNFFGGMTYSVFKGVRIEGDAQPVGKPRPFSQ